MISVEVSNRSGVEVEEEAAADLARNVLAGEGVEDGELGLHFVGLEEMRTLKRDHLGVDGRIEAYLAGDLHALDEIKVNPGGTEFQQTVWSALREIPAGTTQTYGQLAASIGRPSAPRAVGLANGQNPVSIVIPCHRLIGSNGALTGYAGGLDRKRWLLRHEGALLS